MKFLHTADWHIGKKLHDFSLFEDQEDAFDQIEKIAIQENVDAIVIAGDLYDRSIPNEDAVRLLNRMLIKLNLTDKIPLLAISGNHDSAVRLNTGSDWFKATDFYMNTRLKDAFSPVTIKDTQFFLLPYFEITEARNFFNEEKLSLAKAIQLIVNKMQELFEDDKKHVLIAHFFAAGSSHCDSETQVEVGGLDSVPLDLLNSFDYVALGHLHSKNALHNSKIKYSGSPVKFSVSEAKDEKGVWIVDTDQPQEKMAQWKPLIPKNDIVVLQETFETLTDPNYYRKIDDQQFVAVRLEDKEIIPNVMNRLREFYPRIISFQRQNGRKQIDQEKAREIKKLAPMELLRTFYKEITGSDLSETQSDFAQKQLTKAERGEE